MKHLAHSGQALGDRLHVQRRPRSSAGLLLLLLLLFAQSPSACGYRAVYSGPRPTERLSVELAGPRVVEPLALEAVLAGARGELARAGVLAPSGYPKMTIEVGGIQARSTGVAAPAGQPVERGQRVSITGRAWVTYEAGGAVSHDTADLRRTTVVASANSAEIAVTARHNAVRYVGQRLGRALAQSVLGIPQPALEP